MKTSQPETLVTKASSTIPIEKLRFTIGDNQAENYARLIEYLAEQVLEEYGRKMAYILEN